MTKQPETPMPLKITVGEHEIIRGDRHSAAVIFNNLSGVNFQNPPSWQSGTHENYVAYMSGQVAGDIGGLAIGTEITLRLSATDAVIATTKIGAPNAPRVNQALLENAGLDLHEDRIPTSDLPLQAFHGMHPVLWDAMKDKGCPNWRSAGLTATPHHADAWFALLTGEEVDSALAAGRALAALDPDKLALIRQHGYDVTTRDPKMRPDFPGRFMASDDQGDDFSPTFCLVGDDPAELLDEAIDDINQRFPAPGR